MSYSDVTNARLLLTPVHETGVDEEQVEYDDYLGNLTCRYHSISGGYSAVDAQFFYDVINTTGASYVNIQTGAGYTEVWTGTGNYTHPGIEINGSTMKVMDGATVLATINNVDSAHYTGISDAGTWEVQYGTEYSWTNLDSSEQSDSVNCGAVGMATASGSVNCGAQGTEWGSGSVNGGAVGVATQSGSVNCGAQGAAGEWTPVGHLIDTPADYGAGSNVEIAVARPDAVFNALAAAWAMNGPQTVDGAWYWNGTVNGHPFAGNTQLALDDRYDFVVEVVASCPLYSGDVGFYMYWGEIRYARIDFAMQDRDAWEPPMPANGVSINANITNLHAYDDAVVVPAGASGKMCMRWTWDAATRGLRLFGKSYEGSTWTELTKVAGVSTPATIEEGLPAPILGFWDWSDSMHYLYPSEEGYYEGHVALHSLKATTGEFATFSFEPSRSSGLASLPFCEWVDADTGAYTGADQQGYWYPRSGHTGKLYGPFLPAADIAQFRVDMALSGGTATLTWNDYDTGPIGSPVSLSDGVNSVEIPEGEYVQALITMPYNASTKLKSITAELLQSTTGGSVNAGAYGAEVVTGSANSGSYGCVTQDDSADCGCVGAASESGDFVLCGAVGEATVSSSVDAGCVGAESGSGSVDCGAIGTTVAAVASANVGCVGIATVGGSVYCGARGYSASGSTVGGSVNCGAVGLASVTTQSGSANCGCEGATPTTQSGSANCGCVGVVSQWWDVGNDPPEWQRVENQPEGFIKMGVYNTGQDLAALVEYEALVGRKMDIYNVFHAWSEDFDLGLFTALGPRGTIPMLTWGSDGVTLSAIASGSLDTRIIEVASNLGAVGGTVWLRFCHEMNGNWYPWGVPYDNDDPLAATNTPALYIAAFQRVASLMPDNVKMVWCPNTQGRNSDGTWNANFAQFYPGACVDYVGLDGYNDEDITTWTTFEDTFIGWHGAYTLAVSFGKPFIICETSTRYADTDLWVRGMFQSLRTTMSDTEAVCWFNGHTAHWDIEETAAGLEAYKSEMCILDKDVEIVTLNPTSVTTYATASDTWAEAVAKTIPDYTLTDALQPFSTLRYSSNYAGNKYNIQRAVMEFDLSGVSSTPIACLIGVHWIFSNGLGEVTHLGIVSADSYASTFESIHDVPAQPGYAYTVRAFDYDPSGSTMLVGMRGDHDMTGSDPTGPDFSSYYATGTYLPYVRMTCVVGGAVSQWTRKTPTHADWSSRG